MSDALIGSGGKKELKKKKKKRIDIRKVSIS